MAKKKTTKKKVSKKAVKLGQPTKFDEKYIPVIKRLILKGYYDYEIADLLGVTEKTYYNWKKKYPDYFHTEKDLKAQADREVVRALEKLAKGYEVKETKVFCTKDGDIKTYDVIKHLPPNQKSIEFYLTNRKGKDWKNKVEHGIGAGEDLKEFTLSYKLGDSKKKKKK